MFFRVWFEMCGKYVVFIQWPNYMHASVKINVSMGICRGPVFSLLNHVFCGEQPVTAALKVLLLCCLFVSRIIM
jgi:hypothetical protein